MARFNKTNARKASRNPQTGENPGYLSMQQEARNTGCRNLWHSNSQLRHQTVQFVSAGNLEQSQEHKPASIAEEPSRNGESHMGGETSELIPNDFCGYQSDSSPANENVAMTGSPGLPVRLRPLSPTDSSEDEVIFRGRRTRSKPPSNCHVDSRSAPINGGVLAEIDGEPPAYTQAPITSTDLSPDDASSVAFGEDTPDWIGIHDHSNRNKISDEDDVLADYIAHILENESEIDGSSSTEGRHFEHGTIQPISQNVTRSSVSEDDGSDHHGSSPAEVLGDAHATPSGLSRSTRKKSKKSTFASATAFTDALELDPYYGLDVMDFSRPSLSKKKYKKHAHCNFEAVDTELENELVNAWNNDRLKKKAKKREREDLRVQGLLGRRKNDPDLKAKYVNGIDIEDLKSEIQLFLLSPKNSLSLPPMTKHRRMLIHDMAHSLRLTSQSRGKGSSRFPVLSKTSRTPKYTHRTVSQMERVFSKEKFSSRALMAWDKSRSRPDKAKRGHGNVSYVDGDVVGASAPEIGAGNKGRAMLEKMGWSTGTALGAINNKGILLPVAQVVKNSKTGLG